MKLSDIEFRAMDSWWRRWGQQYFELPLLGRLGVNIKDKDVLEIGCGNGYGAHLIHQQAPHSYVGVDVMTEQIEKARQRYPQFTFLIQDATNLSQFADASKNVVVIFGVLHHIPEWRKVIDEIHRVLKPNGSLFVEEPRGMDLKLFDFFFRWGHPDSDFGINRMEGYLKSLDFSVHSKRWTPLMTMVHAKSTQRRHRTLWVAALVEKPRMVFAGVSKPIAVEVWMIVDAKDTPQFQHA